MKQFKEKLIPVKKNTTTKAETSKTGSEKEMMNVLLDALQNRVFVENHPDENEIDNSDVCASVTMSHDCTSTETDINNDADTTIEGFTQENLSKCITKKTAFSSKGPSEIRLVNSKDSNFDHGTVNGYRSLIHAQNTDVSKSTLDPLVMRFERIADVLDRPNGVDEAVKTIALMSLINPTTVCSAKCPFEKLEDENDFFQTIIHRVKCIKLP